MAALGLQAADGSFPAGCNGPYADRETPVRNTAHWLITLLALHGRSGEAALREAAARAAGYLLSDAARPMGASFLCRTTPERDFCNGLIGQAWVFEAMATAAEPLGRPQLRELARELFLRHPFDERTGLWRCLNIDGSYGPVDMTFNHQLWFAASGALIEADSRGEVGGRVVRFLDRALENHLKLDPSGRIAHFVPDPSRSPARRLLAQALQPLKRLRRKPAAIHKEIGYHAFNLYAFALLRRQLPHHPLWSSGQLRSALRFVDSPVYEAGLEANRFGYPYNPAGFEVAFAMQCFGEHGPRRRSAAWWVEQQLRRSYDCERRMLSKNSEDDITLAARLYEATRLDELVLSDEFSCKGNLLANAAV